MDAKGCWDPGHGRKVILIELNQNKAGRGQNGFHNMRKGPCSQPLQCPPIRTCQYGGYGMLLSLGASTWNRVVIRAYSLLAVLWGTSAISDRCKVAINNGLW
ncbi:unnamed protein product [Ostreobium quekettii]|uniref:Uncharacterized protein n=1 Tax=Ostreobium quekettii TaxID=121088 RepID=A0A8S1IVR6_9CHLO|nr:unnamed protein product [Ostreobium quekettii]